MVLSCIWIGMRKNDLIPVCNYAKAYETAWDAHVAFVERGEAEYPFIDSPGSPDVVSLLGGAFAVDTALFAVGDGDVHAAWAFALTLALEQVPVMLCGFGPVYKALRQGLDDGGGRYELVLMQGMAAALRDRRKRRSLCQLLSAGCAAWSPFQPGFANEPLDKEAALYHKTLGMLKRHLVVFGLKPYLVPSLEGALMAGSSVSLHSAFLQEGCLRRLAFEGAPLVEGPLAWMEARSLVSGHLVIEAPDGEYCFGGRRYAVLPLGGT